MSSIAVNICLLPEESMQVTAIAASKKLDGGLVLSSEQTIPHITLDMGFINQNDLENLSNVLSAFARVFMAFELSASQFTIKEVEEKGELCSYSIVPTEELMVLQSEVSREFGTLKEESDASIDSFSEKMPANETTFKWTLNHTERIKEEGFDPHITLGFGTPPAQVFPLNFKANTIALFKLGNYCSCQELLFEQRLEEA